MTDIKRMDQFIASLGVEAYRVGGSVRDELIGREPKDADYMVRGKTIVELGYALVSASRSLGGKVKTLQLRDGRQAGHRVHLPKIGVAEIVLPRKEVSTGPGHRDFEILVDPEVTLAEDARRRDFTFNALYKPIGDGNGNAVGDETDATFVVDPTGRGLHDLQRRFINTTHEDSFRDDPLRILRALRFVARGYELGSNTLEQMDLYSDAVTGLTANGYASGTVLEEFSKILMGTEAPKALRIARDTSVLEQVFPELEAMIGFYQHSKFHDLTVDEHTFKALETAVAADAPLEVRWALLFHDSGKPDSAWCDKGGRYHYYEPTGQAEEDLRGPLDDDVWNAIRPRAHEKVGAGLWVRAAERIGAPRNLRITVEKLIANHMRLNQMPSRSRAHRNAVRKLRIELGDELLELLILHRACDMAGKSKIDPKHGEALARIRADQMNARNAGVPSTVKELKINGNDLIAIGVKGRKIGEVLETLLLDVIYDHIPNDHDELVQRVRR